ncbi:hypothetical protein D3C87_589830 [compost metagenome]
MIIKIVDMFNKSYNQVLAECAVLNGKLRGHTGGKLNSPVRVVQFRPSSPAQDEILSWKNVMICAAIITVYFLIRGLFTR